MVYVVEAEEGVRYPALLLSTLFFETGFAIEPGAMLVASWECSGLRLHRAGAYRHVEPCLAFLRCGFGSGPHHAQ